MSGPDLPQPIYPTPGPGGGGPPAPPGPPPTWSAGPPPSGGPPVGSPPSSGNRVSPAFIVVAVVVALIVVAGGAAALIGGSDDKDKKGGGGTVAGKTDGSTAAGGATNPTTAPDSGGGQEPGADLQGRADAVATRQLITQPSGPVTDCLASGLVADSGLLEILEAQPGVIQLDSPDEAGRYATFIMGCASPEQMTDETVQTVAESGESDVVVLDCLRVYLADLTAEDWVAFIEAAVQPARASEAQAVIVESQTYC